MGGCKLQGRPQSDETSNAKVPKIHLEFATIFPICLKLFFYSFAH